jgi:tripartite-type tricarboxylate transporter receptor subunit TctC
MKRFTLLLSTLMLSGAAAAQSFPTRPIVFVSPFPPGGGNDLISRTITAPMAKSVGQPVIVENRPGAETVVGMSSVANAAPDGYTLILTSSSFAINATLNPKLPYGIKNFEPVSLIGATPMIVTVNAASPVKNMADLIAMAKAKPGGVFVGSSSLASRLGIELLNLMADIKIVHVPYKGAGLNVTDLLANRINLSFATAPAVQANIKAGKLRGIALTGSERSDIMPDLPTVAESAKLNGYEASTWYGVLAPAKTPTDVVHKLSAEFAKSLKDPTVRQVLTKQDIEMKGSTPEQFRAYIVSEIDKWAKVIKFAGVTPE